MKTVVIWFAPILLAFGLYGALYAVLFLVMHPDWLQWVSRRFPNGIRAAAGEGSVTSRREATQS